MLMSNGSDSSFTVASPEDSRLRMARRVGSASAPKVALRGSVVCMVYSITQLINNSVDYAPGRRCLSSGPVAAAVDPTVPETPTRTSDEPDEAWATVPW